MLPSPVVVVGIDATAWKKAKAEEQKKKRQAKAQEKRWARMRDPEFFQVPDSAFLAPLAIQEHEAGPPAGKSVGPAQQPSGQVLLLPRRRGPCSSRRRDSRACNEGADAADPHANAARAA
jgi:hypothetical protein